jgi:hydroxymethylpyrimidine pyrophosphatase-like HAD family hydrolase
MIIFTDIDDTLMKTFRKITDFTSVVPGAIGHNGQHISFIDTSRQRLINKLLNEQVCIPVTARSEKSFSNLLIKFNHQAVLNFGATILNVDKTLDLDWHNSISLKSETLNQEKIFSIVQARLKNLLYDFEVKTAIDNNIYNYLNFRDYSLNPDKITTLQKAVETVLYEQEVLSNFYFYKTDRDLALIPSFIKKEYAVDYLLTHKYSDKELSIGIGDHRNDLSFMSRCDFAMLPTDSSLMKFIEHQSSTR